MPNYVKKLIVKPSSKIRLKHFDPGYHGKHESHKSALPEIQENRQKMEDLQYLMYAENKHSLLIVLDRKSTRLNSSHSQISYAVFCLKKKKILNLFSRSRRKTNKRKSKHSALLRNKDTLHRMFMCLLDTNSQLSAPRLICSINILVRC